MSEPSPASERKPKGGKRPGPNDRIALGELSLPAGARRIVLDFRRRVEGLLRQANGGAELTLAQQMRVRGACLLLAESKRAQLRLAKDLTDDQLAAWSDRCIRHAAALERTLAQLGLADVTAPDPWADVHGAAVAATLPHDLNPKRPDAHPAEDRSGEAKPEALPGVEVGPQSEVDECQT